MNGLEAMLLRGRRSAWKGNLKGSEDAFSKAIALDPSLPYARFARAAVRSRMEKRSEAESDWRFLEILPASEFARYRELDDPFPEGAFPNEARFERWVLRRPDLPWAGHYLAYRLRAAGREKEAAVQALNAARCGKQSPVLRAFAARALAFAGRSASGLREVSRALERAPDAGWIAAWKAELHRRRRESRSRNRCLRLALKLSPEYPRAQAWQGALQVERGRYAEGARSLDRALSEKNAAFWGSDFPERRDGHHAWVLYSRFEARRALGKWSEAFDDLDRARAVNARYEFDRGPGESRNRKRSWIRRLGRACADPRARGWRGWLRFEAGDWNEAEKDLRDALEAMPGTPEWAYRLGRLRWAQNRPEEAAAFWKRALRRQKDHLESLAWMGTWNRTRGRLGEARRFFESSLRRDPFAAWVSLRLTEVLIALGEREGAKTRLQQAEKLLPGDSTAKVLRALFRSRQSQAGKSRRKSLKTEKRKKTDEVPRCVNGSIGEFKLRARKRNIILGRAR